MGTQSTSNRDIGSTQLQSILTANAGINTQKSELLQHSVDDSKSRQQNNKQRSLLRNCKDHHFWIFFIVDWLQNAFFGINMVQSKRNVETTDLAIHEKNIGIILHV